MKGLAASITEGRALLLFVLLLQTSCEQSVQIGWQVTALCCLQCMFEFSERKLRGAGQLQPHQHVLGSMSMGLPALCKGEALLAAFLPCLLSPFALGSAAICQQQQRVLALRCCLGDGEGGNTASPTRGCLFSLPELHRGEASSSVGHTVVGPVPVLGTAQLFPV